jgi:hypothetical protein
MHGCPLTKASQEPSTAPWVLDGICGNENRDDLTVFQKGGFLSGLYARLAGQTLILSRQVYPPILALLKERMVFGA